MTTQLLSEHGGADGKVIVIDTENTFRPERVAQMCVSRHGLDPDQVLENIQGTFPPNSELLMYSDS